MIPLNYFRSLDEPFEDFESKVGIPVLKSATNFEHYQLSPGDTLRDVTFMESLILAQDERWRRA